MHPPNTSHVVLVAILSVAIPIIFRIVASPFALILISPILLLLLLAACISFNTVVGYALDTRKRWNHATTLPARPLAFSTPAAWQVVLTRSQWAYKPPQSLPPIHPDSPMISAAVNDILIMIVRDFVLTWYKDISSSPSFPTAISSTLHSSLERLLKTLESLDLADILVKRILPKITAHVEQFRESEVALRGAGLERRLTESDELDMLLASRYAGKGGGKLHSAVDNLSSSFTKQSEEAHLKRLIDRALPFILPENEARSQAVTIVVREIVSCSVLYPLLDMFSDPDFWNRTIDQLAGAAIRQQRLISKVRNILEAQIPQPEHRIASPKSSVPETITVRTDARHFESFLRSISRTSSLLDARRLKNDIVGEIRRTRLLLANHEREDWINGEKTEDVVAFLDRLYTAKRKAEERISVLGGLDEGRHSVADPGSAVRLTLRDILGNPNSLSYFMEFLDRRDRSLLVQFWLTVESFKNPLESVDSGSDDEGDPVPGPSDSSTVKEDVSMIFELYFSSATPHPALISVSAKHAAAIREFVATDHPSPVVERKARRSVMLAQQQVEKATEQDFEDFERSELWFRVVEDINGSRGQSSSVGSPRPRRPSLASRDTVMVPTTKAKHPLPSPVQRADSFPSFILPLGSAASFTGRPEKLSTTPSPDPPPSSPFRPSPSTLDLLMSPASDSESRETRAPLFDDPDDRTQDTRESRSTVDAIQAALTDIIALDNQQAERKRPAPGGLFDSFSEQDVPFLLHSQRSGSQEDFLEDKGDDAQDHRADDDIQMARPGDFQLSHEIARLSNKISALETQDAMLDTLIKKADLTGDEQEKRLLHKSKSALTREIRELAFQKSQYEQQDSDNRIIPDRTRLAIVNSVVGEENGKGIVRYLVEVQQLAPDGTVTTGWVVARRYNEFLNMHNRLRERFAKIRGLDFPGKRLVTALSSSFVDTRRTSLEKYLQNVVLIPAVCESDELRAFLSRNSPFIVSEPEGRSSDAAKASTSVPALPGSNLVKSVYNTVAESIDDMFFGPSMLDVMLQRLTRQAADLAGIVGHSVNDEDVVAQALGASGKTASDDALLQFSGDLKPLDGETSTSTFSAPISDLVLAVFELNKKNNWLRRQAIVTILQQVLGSTVERKLRETLTSFLDESHIMGFINIFRDSMWPGGKMKPSSIPRTREERMRTRDDANRKLSALMPDLVANMIGRSNARRGARRIFAVLQNRRLNQHIVYTVLDEVRTLTFAKDICAKLVLRYSRFFSLIPLHNLDSFPYSISRHDTHLRLLH
ncbi:PXA domain-containing protein [Amylostereum chailletii]|nr:PXA domain-containing protein [Amylostereum chailletii]